MPIYNSAPYLAEAIESVLAQTFADFELLIWDDGSTDGTAEIAAAYAARDPRIVFHVHASNVGMVRNWNLCMEQARGKYLKFLFGDDLLSRDALARMARELDEDPAVSLVASGRTVIDAASRPLETLVHFPPGRFRGTEAIRRCIDEQVNLIGEPSAVMFRKAQAERGFDPELKQVVDLEMWYHLLEKGRLAYIAEPLCCFRKHQGQQTRKNEQNLVNFGEFFALSGAYLRKPYLGFGWWGARWFLFQRYYVFWKIFRKQEQFRQAAADIIDRQYGKRSFLAMTMVYKLYNPCRKAARLLHTER